VPKVVLRSAALGRCRLWEMDRVRLKEFVSKSISSEYDSLCFPLS